MTTPQPGDPFHLDIDGTVIAGRYIAVDAPRSLLIGWDLQGIGSATVRPALIEFTFAPTGEGDTAVEVQLSGLSEEDAEIYRPLFARYLNRIKATFPGRTEAANTRYPSRA